jgi:hypothetical protein
MNIVRTGRMNGRLLADSPGKAIFAASSSAGEVMVASRSPSMSSKILVVPQW